MLKFPNPLHQAPFGECYERLDKSDIYFCLTVSLLSRFFCPMMYWRFSVYICSWKCHSFCFFISFSNTFVRKTRVLPAVRFWGRVFSINCHYQRSEHFRTFHTIEPMRLIVVLPSKKLINEFIDYNCLSSYKYFIHKKTSLCSRGSAKWLCRAVTSRSYKKFG